jgi:hypothetical protein
MDNSARLCGKKILFLGIGFYDYETAIIKQLSENGAETIYFNVSEYNLLSKIILHIPLFKIDKYYDYRLMRFLKKDKNIYDFIFVIKGEYIKMHHCIHLKKMKEDGKLILYLWDSVQRINGLHYILPYFDTIFSFDHDDVNKYGFIFRPLFFRPEVLLLPEENRIYDVSFIGTNHSDRMAILTNITNYINRNGSKSYIRIWIRKIELIKLLIITLFNKQDMSIFITKPLSFQDYCRILKKSKCIIDINHPKQSGLTMRSIESLAAGCFLITTNEHINKYIDFPSSVYFILDRKNSNIDKLDTNKIFPLDKIKNLEYYSLKNFISDIFIKNLEQS